MKVMFLDESGNHNLKRVNPTYPVFVFGGAIVDRAYVRNTIEPEIQQFKMTHFGRTDVILHIVEMGRGRGDYAFLANPAKRSAFYGDLNDLLQRCGSTRWSPVSSSCRASLPNTTIRSIPITMGWRS